MRHYMIALVLLLLLLVVNKVQNLADINIVTIITVKMEGNMDNITTFLNGCPCSKKTALIYYSSLIYCIDPSPHEILT